MISCRRAICWKELFVESLRRYFFCRLGNALHRRGLVVCYADPGYIGGCYGFRGSSDHRKDTTRGHALDSVEHCDIKHGGLYIISLDYSLLVHRFATKLSAIVSREMKSNFLTKLHRGNFAISPWPVIESPDFYNAFNDIYHDFMDQPITHEHAGAFYILLKTLMAKIYIADWSAVDQSLALHRAELLESSVDNALCFGLSDPGTGERLKVLHTKCSTRP
ncbi:hypothetical protein PIIN_03104 [Serendipita indica DSM 11827]|uniref:Uncharacterized protein n=1 Tax=Serendipita indica (strain DSM 11827) TaxID=1109443 RepID=G4TD06_SERID|nr:hypothetical protein PIIN_03104 [Serendipita indica DSM 11827]